MNHAGVVRILSVLVTAKTDRKVHKYRLVHIARTHGESKALFLKGPPVSEPYCGVDQWTFHLLAQRFGLNLWKVCDDMRDHHVVAGHDDMVGRDLKCAAIAYVADEYFISTFCVPVVLNIYHSAAETETGGVF